MPRFLLLDTDDWSLKSSGWRPACVETLREYLNQAKLAGFSHSFEYPDSLKMLY